MAGATFQNLGFELAGAGPGLAAGWTLGFRATAEEIAQQYPVVPLADIYSVIAARTP